MPFFVLCRFFFFFFMTGMIWQNAECWSTNELPSINYVGLRKKKHTNSTVVVKSGTVKIISNCRFTGIFSFMNNKSCLLHTPGTVHYWRHDIINLSRFALRDIEFNFSISNKILFLFHPIDAHFDFLCRSYTFAIFFVTDGWCFQVLFVLI